MGCAGDVPYTTVVEAFFEWGNSVGRSVSGLGEKRCKFISNELNEWGVGTTSTVVYLVALLLCSKMSHGSDGPQWEWKLFQLKFCPMEVFNIDNAHLGLVGLLVE